MWSSYWETQNTTGSQKILRSILPHLLQSSAQLTGASQHSWRTVAKICHRIWTISNGETRPWTFNRTTFDKKRDKHSNTHYSQSPVTWWSSILKACLQLQASQHTEVILVKQSHKANVTKCRYDMETTTILFCENKWNKEITLAYFIYSPMLQQLLVHL